MAARELVCVQNYHTVDKRLRVDAQLRRQPATTLSRPAAKQGDVRFRVDLEKHGSWIASKKLRSRQRAAVRRAQYIQQKKKEVMRGSVYCKPNISDHIMILMIVMFICFINKIKALRRKTNNQHTLRICVEFLNALATDINISKVVTPTKPRIHKFKCAHAVGKGHYVRKAAKAS